MYFQGYTKGQGPVWDANPGLSDSKILNERIVLELSLLSKEAQAWGLSRLRDVRFWQER